MPIRFERWSNFIVHFHKPSSSSDSLPKSTLFTVCATTKTLQEDYQMYKLKDNLS